MPTPSINPATAATEGVKDLGEMLVSTETGSLKCRVKTDKNIGPGIVSDIRRMVDTKVGRG